MRHLFASHEIPEGSKRLAGGETTGYESTQDGECTASWKDARNVIVIPRPAFANFSRPFRTLYTHIVTFSSLSGGSQSLRFFHHRLMSLLTLGAMAILAGLLLPMTGISAEPLGKLGSIELTIDDLRDSILSLNDAQIASLRADPALLEQIARTSLVQKLILQEATEKKWQEQPHISARIRRAHDSAITESYLESLSQPAKDFPSEDEVKAAYQSARESLKVPRSFRLAQIFIAEDKARLAKVEEQLSAKSADFAKIAKEHSQEPTSASRGGEIGWLTEAQIDKDLLTPIAKLKLNEVSKPVKLKDGWHVLKLLDARAEHTSTLEQARPQIVKQLRQEKLRANTQAYLAKLLKEHPLTLQSEALIKVLPKDSSAHSRP